MQQRRGTATQWTAADPILAAGEIGYESNTGKFKIGDGINHWSSLSYFADASDFDTTSIQASIASAVSNAVNALVDDAPAALNTLKEIAEAIDNDSSFSATLVALISNLDSTVSGHVNDTTNIHGIENTAQLATKTYADNAAATVADAAELDATTKADAARSDAIEAATAEAATDATAKADAALQDAKDYTDGKASDYEAAGAVLTHNNLGQNVHGIANTAELVTNSVLETATTDLQETMSDYADTAAANAQSAAISAASSDAASKVSTHSSVTTNVHGIADTSALATKTYVDNADALLAPKANPTFTGTVSGVTKAMVGLANVDNTSDADKPVSTAAQTALDLKAPKANATFTGTVVLPSTTSIGNVSATELGYVDGVTSAIQTQIDSKLALTGGTMTGALTLSGAPTSDLHAATKQYVDNVTAGINFHEAVHAASVNNLAANYSNGTSGVGATLTADTNRAFTQIDGESVVVGQRVLVKNQTDAKQNGIYTLTTNGSGSTPWVLTRATDADNNPVGELKNGDFCLVINGTVNAGYGYINNSTANPIVLGTSDVTYTAFNAGKTVSAGTGLTESTPGTLDIATGGVTSALIADGTIVDGDINASAAIAQSKISGLTSDLAAKAPLANPTFTGTVTLPASGIVFSDGTQAKVGVPSATTIQQKTASYTLSAVTERDNMIELSSSSALTVTIPADSTVNYPVGTSIDILQTSTGQVTVAGAGGVTVNATPGLKLRTQWSSATLTKRAANTWVVTGDLSA